MRDLLRTRNVFVILLTLGLITMAARTTTDPDLWWHLRTGQLMVQTHHIFRTDPYSFTRYGQPWIDHEWLSQLLIYGLYKMGGWGGLIPGFGLIIGTGFILLFLRSPGRPYLAGLMTTWAAVASIPCWGPRPQMLTFLLASVFLLILERSYDRPFLLWWTPGLMILWVNLHGGYALGLAFLALFLIGDGLDVAFGFSGPAYSSRIRVLALAIVGCLAVIPLNPFGVRMYSYPLQTLTSHAIQGYITEWASPDFHQGKYLPTLLMILGTIAFPMLAPRRLRPRNLLLLAATTFLALRSVRHIPIYVLVAAPILSEGVQPWLERFTHARALWQPAETISLTKARLNGALLAGFTAFCVLRVWYVIGNEPEAVAREFPKAAVSFISEHRPPAPVLNPYNWGGYCIWRIYPQYKVFIDGRTDLYGDSLMEIFAAAYSLKGESWYAAIEKWRIQTVMLPPDAPLAAALRAMPVWRSVYSDSQAVIFTRSP
jgi:hypothetical protein